MSGLEVCLSGTIDVEWDGRELAVPGRRVRTLLALLALSAGRTVPVERIAAGLWDDDPPVRVRGSIQTYVGRLRRVLGSELIVTKATGYLLDLPRDRVDLLAMADTLQRAEHARTPEEERELLLAALARWQGPPFGAASSDWLAHHESPLWIERRLQALERLGDLDLASGAYAACALEFQRLVAEHPLRESLWTRWLTALHRSGRTADALHHYEQVRALLADELGVDPSTELRALHAEMLGGPSSPTAGPITGPRDDPLLNTLPGDITSFTGRNRELGALDELLAEANGSRAVVALHGRAGAGKTTLAVHWAHSVEQQFPGGRLFLDLRGFGPGEPLTTAEALAALLQAVGVPGSQLPDAVDDRAGLWRRHTGDTRMLLVLDNARDSSQLRPLLPAGTGLVLVTSRTQLRSLTTREGARRVLVDSMSESESVEMLTQRLGMPDHGDELADLARLCDHLPIALAVAAEQAGRGDDRSLGAVVGQLRDERHRLQRLTAWEDDSLTSVRAVFDWSYRTLGGGTARMLRLLGLAPDSRISVAEAAALAGRSLSETEREVDRLADGHLLVARDPGWFDLHDLTRAYAVDLQRVEGTAQDRDAALRRSRSWYLHTVDNAAALIGPPHPIIVLGPPEPGVEPQTFADGAEAFAWFLARRRALTNVVTRAAAEGDHATTYTIVPLLATFLASGSGFQEELRLHLLAEASARSADDVVAQAVCATHVGMTFGRSRAYDEARRWFTRARELFARVDHVPGELHVMMALGIVLTHVGEADRAVAILEETLAGARAQGLDVREAATLNNLAVAYSRQGRHDEAVRAAESAVAEHGRLDNPLNQAMALDTLGAALLRKGSVEAAYDALERALAIHSGIGESRSLATALKNLGLAEERLDRAGDARRHWQEALAILDRVDAPDTSDVSRDELRGLLGQARVSPA